MKNLEKLAEHLERGQLGHKVFDFSTYNSNGESSIYAPECGTNGCAIGECPILFPEDWKFDGYGMPILLNGSIRDFFGIDPEQYRHLFIPYEQQPEKFGGKILDGSATRYEVAANIRAFIERLANAENSQVPV